MSEIKLIVGLGNPGNNFIKTRHNLGFRIIDYLTKTLENSSEIKSKTADDFSSSFSNKFNGEYSFLLYQEKRFIFLKPQTYMNNSGKCVKDFIDYYQLSLSNILVIYDDLSLPLTQLRLRQKGSSGGHNGILSLIEYLGSSDFSRIRIGIGQKKDVSYKDWVLQTFSLEEEKKLVEVFPKVAKIVLYWLEEKLNFSQLMNLTNKKIVN